MTAGENQAGGGAGEAVRGFGWGQGMEGGRRRGSSGGGEDGVEGVKGSHEEVEVGLGGGGSRGERRWRGRCC